MYGFRALCVSFTIVIGCAVGMPATAQDLQVLEMRRPCVMPDIPTGFRVVKSVPPAVNCEDEAVDRWVKDLGRNRRGDGRNSATYLQFIDLRLGVAWRMQSARTWAPVPQWQHDVIADVDPADGNTLCAQPQADGSINEWILDGTGHDCELAPMPLFYRQYLPSGHVCVEPSNYCVEIADPMPAEGQRRAKLTIDGVKKKLLAQK